MFKDNHFLEQPELGKLIRYHRGQSGLSRQALCDLAGVSPAVLYRLEHGKQSVRLDVLQRVLRALNLRVHIESPLSPTMGDA